MLLGQTQKNNFNNDKYLNQYVFVVGFDYKGSQTDFEVYDNYEEAKERYSTLNEKNINKDCTYTLEKCIVKSDELETIETY